MSRKKD